MAIIITMASITVGGSILEKILNKMGENDKAQMVGVVTTSTLAVTVVGSVIAAISQIRKLG